MKRFAVFGSPIAHSLSPQIHQAFAKQCNIALSYEKILTLSGHLNTQLAQFRSCGGVGANITLPLKQEAYLLCDDLTEQASKAKAVNTLYWQDEKLWGDNTDGEGLLRDLTRNLALSLQKKRILILGAGGATLGIIGPLLAENPKSVVIVNRTLEKAQAICEQSPLMSAYDYEHKMMKNETFDMVINATSCSLHNILPPLAKSWIKDSIAIDLAYKQNQQTIFQQWAIDNGASQTFDGLGMLIEQAALGFEKWHHQTPNTQALIKMFREGVV